MSDTAPCITRPTRPITRAQKTETHQCLVQHVQAQHHRLQVHPYAQGHNRQGGLLLASGPHDVRLSSSGLQHAAYVEALGALLALAASLQTHTVVRPLQTD